MMHIITGSARGVRLETLPGEKTRPTAERTKEAVFSMLQFDLEGRRVLDLFAGSGQLGLEALSRGAAFAVMVDQAKEACAVINRNATKTKLASKARILSMEALAYLRGCADAPFHLVFLDPPYAAGLLPPVLEALADQGLLAPNATVVAECGDPNALFGENEALRARYEITKNKRYGAAHVFFLSPVAHKEEI